MVYAIVDSRISEKMARSLEKQGFSLIRLPRSKDLGEAVCSHPDSLIFKLGSELIAPSDYCDDAAYVFSDIREYAPKYKITFASDNIGAIYPSDTKFNALLLGKRLFARLDSLSLSILEAAARRGIECINTKQGYPACSTLALGDNCAVTADRGMAKVLRDHGVTVYEIECGSIELPPHEYGFIGGAAGVHNGVVYFLGNLDSHRSAGIIKDACNAAKVAPVSLSDEPLADLGRIIFID